RSRMTPRFVRQARSSAFSTGISPRGRDGAFVETGMIRIIRPLTAPVESIVLPGDARALRAPVAAKSVVQQPAPAPAVAPPPVASVARRQSYSAPGMAEVAISAIAPAAVGSSAPARP